MRITYNHTKVKCIVVFVVLSVAKGVVIRKVCQSNEGQKLVFDKIRYLNYQPRRGYASLQSAKAFNAKHYYLTTTMFSPG
jgi:hypothetical protein